MGDSKRARVVANTHLTRTIYTHPTRECHPLRRSNRPWLPSSLRRAQHPAALSPPSKTPATRYSSPPSEQPSAHRHPMHYPDLARAFSARPPPSAAPRAHTSSAPPSPPTPSSSSFRSRQHGSSSAWDDSTGYCSRVSPSSYL